MVTRGTYYDEDEQFARRYSSRGHGYPLSHDREPPPTHHHAPYARQHMSSHNTQNRQSPEQDTNAQPRRRIPVACGRCRKRKIRCSGDPGNGQPCINCKTAGNESCQFLRVSSQEAPMKNDGAEFGYDSAAAVSRVHCRTSPYGPQHQPYTPHVTTLGPEGFPPYRHNSISAYQPIKYYGISSYGDFAEDNVEYGMHASNYSIMNQEPPISTPYTSIGSARTWGHPQLQKSNSLFVEQDTSYTQLPSYSNPFPYRPNISPDSKSLSLHSMASALPPSTNGTDRVLPAPASYRTAQVAGPYLRPIENNITISQQPMHSTCSNNGLMSTHMINAVKALSASSASESSSISSTYLPLSSSPESVPSSQMSFGTHSVSSTQQNHDGYTPSHDAPRQSLFQHANNSTGDVGSYSTSCSNRRSISSNNGEDSQPLSNNGNGIGSLMNGYCYIPPVSTQYPHPPIVSAHQESMPSTAPPIARQPVSAT